MACFNNENHYTVSEEDIKEIFINMMVKASHKSEGLETNLTPDEILENVHEAVKEWESTKTNDTKKSDYDSMTVKELKELAKERNVKVLGTGSQGKPKKSDYVEALVKDLK